MSDLNSSLPIRTEADGDVVVKVSDGTVTSQHLKVNADGSVSIDDNGGSLTVDGTVELGATSLAALESITVQNGAAGAAVNIQDGGNSITVDATALDIRALAFLTDKVDASGSVVALDAPTLAALESITVQNGSGIAAVNIQDGGNSITVDGAVTVSATALDIRALAFATDKVDVSGSAVNADLRIAGAAVTTLNPVPVVMSTAIPGTAIQDYATGSAIAAGASSTHDYTVSALKSLQLSRVWSSASGKIKVQVQYETAAASGVFNTKFVGFNSTANPNIDITVAAPFTQVTGAKIRVIITNLDKAAEDVYSTIEGTEV
jgi:hypothetical protein